MNHKDKDSIMRISPISSYKSSPQRFTGTENPITRRQFIQTAGTVAAGAVLVPAAIAKPQQDWHIFDFERFNVEILKNDFDPKYKDLGAKQTVDLFVTNRFGEKNGFTEIIARMTDDVSQKEIAGQVGAIIDAPHESVEKVLLFDFDEKLFLDTTDKDVFKFVKKYVDVDSKFDLSNIVIITRENGKPKLLRDIRNLR